MSIFVEKRDKSQLFETKHFWGCRDGFPVSPGHTLIISKRPMAMEYFDLTDDEKGDLQNAIQKAKDTIVNDLNISIMPDGYNIGMNCGVAAGQSVPHFHCHLIPRYSGDCENPRGGVRHVIPGKGNY